MCADHILDIAFAFRKSKALLSAVELGLFAALAEEPLDCETLVKRLGLHGRGARDFFDALVSLGFLGRDSNGRYANTQDSDLYLDPRKPTYVGSLLQYLNDRMYECWVLLTPALRTGAPQGGLSAAGGFPAFFADESTIDIFLKGMTGGSLLPAQALAASFPWHVYSTVIDIGTAQGGVPVEIAGAHAHLTGGGFDLPVLEPAFAKYVRERGLGDRLRFYAGDFLVDPLPQADVLIMGRVLHDWDIPIRRMLLQKAFVALPAGGALIVHDALIDDARRHRTHSLLASLNMLIQTAGGSEYTGADCIEWMQQAGFTETRVVPLAGMQKAVIGIRGAP